MITFERFEKLNQHRWSDDEMQKNYAIALEVEKNYIEKFGSIKGPKLGDYDLEDYASNIYFNKTKVSSLKDLTELIFAYRQEITPSDIASLRKYPGIVPTEDVYKKLCQYANVLMNSHDFDAKEFCKHWNGQEWLTFMDKDTQKRFFVYAGYYENYISVKPMYTPLVYRSNFPTIDEAIAYAESFEDTVIYCENVKDDLPTFLAEKLEEKNEFHNF